MNPEEIEMYIADVAKEIFHDNVWYSYSEVDK